VGRKGIRRRLLGLRACRSAGQHPLLPGTARADAAPPGSPGPTGLLPDRAVDPAEEVGDRDLVAAGAQLAAGAATRGRAALVDGLPGVISWREDGTPLSVLAFTVVDGWITAIAAVVDPARLALMHLPEPA